jgi:hypothetical protein
MGLQRGEMRMQRLNDVRGACQNGMAHEDKGVRKR